MDQREADARLALDAHWRTQWPAATSKFTLVEKSSLVVLGREIKERFVHLPESKKAASARRKVEKTERGSG
jgi:hypothetical protein